MLAEKIRPYFEASIFGFLIGVVIESLCGLGLWFLPVLALIFLGEIILRRWKSVLPAICFGFALGLILVLVYQNLRIEAENKYELGVSEKYLVKVNTITVRNDYANISGRDLKTGEKIKVFGRSAEEFEKGDTIKIIGIGYPIREKTAKEEVVSISATKIVLWKKSKKNFLDSLQLSFRDAIKKMIRDPESSLALGVVLGDGREIPKDINDGFKVAGLSHITVASGYNVSLVSGVASAIGRSLSFYGGIASAAVGVILFPLFSGNGASVWRAVIMALIMLFCSGVGRPYATVRALVYAGVLMVFQNPMILMYDIGFELSFLATLGIALAVSPIKTGIEKITERFGLRESLATTLAAIIFTAPLIAFYFKTFSLVAIPANILVAPLVPVIMFSVFMTGFLGSFSTLLGYPFAFIAENTASTMIKIATYASELPYSQIQIPQISGLLIIIVYILLICVFIYTGYRAGQ